MLKLTFQVYSYKEKTTYPLGLLHQPVRKGRQEEGGGQLNASQSGGDITVRCGAGGAAGTGAGGAAAAAAAVPAAVQCAARKKKKTEKKIFF